MNKIFFLQTRALAMNVLKESVRDRILLFLLGSGVIMLLFSVILGDMAVGGRQRILQNMGFWIMGMWGLVSVIYLGSSIIQRELKQKTIYLVLSRPMNRSTFLLGKFTGMVFVMFFEFFILSLVWFVICKSFGVNLTYNHLISLGFIFGEWILLAAFSLFFSSFTSPILHNFFLIGIYFLGHWSNDLRIFSENVDSEGLKAMLTCIYYILPNLEALNFREAALNSESFAANLLWEGLVLLVSWGASVLLAANIIFSKRRII